MDKRSASTKLWRFNRPMDALALVHPAVGKEYGLLRTAMSEILFLCHRIPYPPNKGDKIRAFHLLRALAEKHTVHLGTFVDDAEDRQYRSTLDALCAETCYRPLSPIRTRIRSVGALIRSQPLTLACYQDRLLQKWVDWLMRERPIDTIVVFSAGVAPYVKRYSRVRRILDFVDVDSEKWRQYAGTARLPLRWLYAREGRTLLAAERALAAAFDVSTFVTDAEVELFCSRAPECSGRVAAIPNGVDSSYFDPSLQHADPYHGAGGRTLVFTGAMDYHANIDAVRWFAHEVLPLIRRQQADVSFAIVGARPTHEVAELADLPGVQVTGAVADVRPWLAHAAVAVAPLRIARGLQNKVLEALAMDRPLLLTPEAATGLKSLDTDYAAMASRPDELAEHALRFLGATGFAERSGAGRRYVLDNYGWPHQLERFLALIEGEPAGRSATDEKLLASGASA